MNLIKLGFQIGVVVCVAEITYGCLSGFAVAILKNIKRHLKKKPESDKVTNIRRDVHE